MPLVALVKDTDEALEVGRVWSLGRKGDGFRETCSVEKHSSAWCVQSTRQMSWTLELRTSNRAGLDRT